MHFVKNIPYKIKRLVPVLGLAGAATMMPGCDKSDEPIAPPIEQPKTRGIELYFDYYDYENIVSQNQDGTYTPSEILKTYANQKDTVYLIPTGTWLFIIPDEIKEIRQKILQPAIDYSPKIRGRGDFDFSTGFPSMIPEDSLWFVEHGWTVNKRLNQIYKSHQR